MNISDLPTGASPEPLSLDHFPTRLHAFVFRNWPFFGAARMAAVVGARPEEIADIGRSMGLEAVDRIDASHLNRSYITIIRRNWHLLPYDQLLDLLEWTPEELAFVLREDDFLYHKLGSLKPDCPRLVYRTPSPAERDRACWIGDICRSFIRDETPDEPLFSFIDDLSRAVSPGSGAWHPESAVPGLDRKRGHDSPRFCSSYFMLYGDPLLGERGESYPDGYLARLSEAGINGVWIQAILYQLSSFPWQPELSHRFEERLANLGSLVTWAAKYGVGVYLYLNEPRAMPSGFYGRFPGYRGVSEEGYSALCTGHPDVRNYITRAVMSICNAAPGLEAIFTISASENLTNCWSHYHGETCPRCAGIGPAGVIVDYHRAVLDGIRDSRDDSGGDTRLIAWDWGWKNEWTADIVSGLPVEVCVQSVSEWDLPVLRGGVASVAGEYSISSVGPGPRAERVWRLAKKLGHRTYAKIQANCTWELASVPYIPALGLVGKHIEALRERAIDGYMLGWTLGGCPSPNLELVAAMLDASAPSVDDAMFEVAQARFGEDAAPHIAAAWKRCSDAFSEFPFHIRTVYFGPQQMGPANLLWGCPTGYSATMVGIPYDDLDAWRGVFPVDVYIRQLDKVSRGFLDAARVLGSSADGDEVGTEIRIIEACAVHFASAANQARFVAARDSLDDSSSPGASGNGFARIAALQSITEDEIRLARRLFELQRGDSRLGFEASNHYFFVPVDLIEKVVCCRELIERRFPSLATKDESNG